MKPLALPQQERFDCLRLARSEQIGPASYRRLIHRFGSAGEALARLPDGGVVMCHPGFVDDELQRLDPLTTLREREYAFLASDSFPAVLASNGVVLA